MVFGGRHLFGHRWSATGLTPSVTGLLSPTKHGYIGLFYRDIGLNHSGKYAPEKVNTMARMSPVNIASVYGTSIQHCTNLLAFEIPVITDIV